MAKIERDINQKMDRNGEGSGDVTEAATDNIRKVAELKTALHFTEF